MPTKGPLLQPSTALLELALDAASFQEKLLTCQAPRLEIDEELRIHGRHSSMLSRAHHINKHICQHTEQVSRPSKTPKSAAPLLFVLLIRKPLCIPTSLPNRLLSMKENKAMVPSKLYDQTNKRERDDMYINQ